MRNYFNYKKTLKYEILSKVVLTILITLITIIIFNYQSGQKLALQSAKNYIFKQNNVINTKIDDFLTRAQEQGDSLSTLLSAPQFQIEQERFRQYIVRQVISEQNIYGISLWLGNKLCLIQEFSTDDPMKGDLQIMGIPVPHEARVAFFIFENPEKSLNAQVSFFNQNAENINEFFADINKNALGDFIKDLPTAYEPEGLKQNSLYFLNQNICMNDHKYIKDPQNNVIGAVTTRISLKDLSLFLNEMNVSDNARILVFNNEGKVLSDSAMLTYDHIIHFEDLNDPTITEAIKTNTNDPHLKEARLFAMGHNQYLTLLSHLPERTNINWSIMTVAPASDFTQAFKEIQNDALILSITALVLALIYLFFQTQKISDPISLLSYEAEKIKNLELDDSITIHSHAYEINELSDSMQNLKTSVANFSKFIPKKLVQKFIDMRQEVEIGGKITDLTIMFSDIESFTAISENLTPNNIAIYLSDYFEEISSIIINHHGTIDKYIGDAVMAFWGAPDANPNHVRDACTAVLLCHEKLSVFNQYWQSQGKPPFFTRFGLHTGEALVGNIGSDERMNYSAIGDAVNIAARLESANKQYKTKVLVSEAVIQKLDNSFVYRPIDIVALKGKNKGLTVYELMGACGSNVLNEPSLQTVNLALQFTEAFELYKQQKWKEALKAFKAIQALHQKFTDVDDYPTHIYIERCAAFMKKPPAQDWDGIIHLQSK